MVLGVWGSLLCLPVQEEGNFSLLTFAFSGLLWPWVQDNENRPCFSLSHTYIGTENRDPALLGIWA